MPAMAKAETARDSTMEIVSLTRWQRPPVCRCSSREAISRKQIWLRHWPILERRIKPARDPRVIPCNGARRGVASLVKLSWTETPDLIARGTMDDMTASPYPPFNGGEPYATVRSVADER